ncbi:recombinase family protein [Nocardia sp. CA-290969]|uniref:recombinase family protein n=1 Tax=Nocardia sp. CA-290969 TaxID=3239986 RepID=UPI003D8FDF1A
MPCPSAHDRRRNPHRSGIAWSKGAVRTILTNPRYTGYAVWNKQHKHESLINVDDVALGHQTRLTWNQKTDWVYSDHPAPISKAGLDNVALRLVSRGPKSGGARHHPHQAHLLLHRVAVPRSLRQANARKLKPRLRPLPLPLSLRIRPRQRPRPSAIGLPARRPADRTPRHLAGRGLPPRPHRTLTHHAPTGATRHHPRFGHRPRLAPRARPKTEQIPRRTRGRSRPGRRRNLDQGSTKPTRTCYRADRSARSASRPRTSAQQVGDRTIGRSLRRPYSDTPDRRTRR